jgi:hypothetical protein
LLKLRLVLRQAKHSKILDHALRWAGLQARIKLLP